MDDKNKSAVQQFLEGTENEQHNPFESVVKDPFEKPVEEKTEVVEEKEEKPLPFHQDPKIQKFIAKEVAKGLQNRTPEPQRENVVIDEFKDVMEAMTTAIGNDTPEKVNALKAYQNALKTLDERSSIKAKQYLEELQNKDKEYQRQADEELDTAFESIEENFGIDLTSSRSQKVREEFLTFVEKIAPKSKDGEILDYPDMDSAWETFSEIKKANTLPSRAKELANRGMARSSETNTIQPKKLSWDMEIEDMIAGTR